MPPLKSVTTYLRAKRARDPGTTGLGGAQLPAPLGAASCIGNKEPPLGYVLSGGLLGSSFMVEIRSGRLPYGLVTAAADCLGQHRVGRLEHDLEEVRAPVGGAVAHFRCVLGT